MNEKQSKNFQTQTIAGVIHVSRQEEPNQVLSTAKHVMPRPIGINLDEQFISYAGLTMQTDNAINYIARAPPKKPNKKERKTWGNKKEK